MTDMKKNSKFDTKCRIGSKWILLSKIKILNNCSYLKSLTRNNRKVPEDQWWRWREWRLQQHYTEHRLVVFGVRPRGGLLYRVRPPSILPLSLLLTDTEGASSSKDYNILRPYHRRIRGSNTRLRLELELPHRLRFPKCSLL